MVTNNTLDHNRQDPLRIMTGTWGVWKEELNSFFLPAVEFWGVHGTSSVSGKVYHILNR